ncbi:hypothetical protein BDN72DRAFT_828670 [Pluteus cervinus]|uniref:Uncharacterized protein n=1 Tax=Pluteus cervinus TaxID=181527 RepID=A0ACD3A4N9_9AGAR|nr:hypothetical protein BDN72DRAFT_828670 [Pluteus cervinus]
MDSEGTIVALARDKIDAEIIALKERIRALRTERNRLAPISRCPPEVLAEIFVWFQQTYLGKLYTSRDFPSNYRKWVVVTHVSQHWRQIALSFKSLWNVIPVRWLGYATESLNRLGPMPMLVVGNETRWGVDYTPLWESIATECHRIRFLRGVVGSSVANFNQPMPFLEHVEITSKCDLSPSVISPSLRTLVLSGCDFTWNWPALPHLTTLEIFDPANRISFDRFVDILQNSPDLKRLAIKNIFRAPTTSSPKDFKPSQPSLLLPQLRYFRSGRSQFSLDLLSQLRFTDRFSIDIHAGEISAGSVPRAMQVFNRILLGSSMTIRVLHLISEYGPRFTLALRERPTYTSTCIDFSFDPPTQGEIPGSYAKHLTILPLDEVDELMTNVMRGSTMWKDSGFGQLPNLRNINVQDTGHTFLEHITKDYEEFKESRNHGTLSFSSLQEVKMGKLQFGRELKYPVCAALAGREKAGYRFKKLVISSGQVSEDSAKQLQKYVDRVEVPAPAKTQGRRRR